MSVATVARALAAFLGGPLVICDVGAQSLAGEEHVYAPLLRLGVPTRLIGFEPLPERAAARRLEEAGQECDIIEAFIGDGAVHSFHECNSSGASSLLDLDRGICSGFASLAGLRITRTTPVATTTLDDALAQSGPIDFLKLDIQGFELAALRGASRTLRQVALIQVETEFTPLYVGQPLFSDIELHLRGAGFGFIDFHTLARRAPVVPSGRIRNEQLLWGDAVFAADPAHASDRALLAQAILALAVYDRWSIAERALSVHDARHGTDLAAMIGRGFPAEPVRTDRCLPPPPPDAGRYLRTSPRSSSCA